MTRTQRTVIFCPSYLPICSCQRTRPNLVPRAFWAQGIPSGKNRANSNPRLAELRFYMQVVGVTGFEPVTPRLSSACSNQLSYTPVSNVELRMMNAERLKPVLHSSFSILHSKVGGAEEIRTPDL